MGFFRGLKSWFDRWASRNVDTPVIVSVSWTIGNDPVAHAEFAGLRIALGTDRTSEIPHVNDLLALARIAAELGITPELAGDRRKLRAFLQQMTPDELDWRANGRPKH